MAKRVVSQEGRMKISIARTKFFSNPENHPRWKGGEIIHREYAYVKDKNHPRANSTGYVKKCFLAVESILGTPVPKDLVVHHINGNKLDDRPINLAIMTSKEHKSLHMKERYTK